jgi:hypothetical protein
LKIYHALKETSYLTDTPIIASFPAIATTIGNYFALLGRLYKYAVCASRAARRVAIQPGIAKIFQKFACEIFHDETFLSAFGRTIIFYCGIRVV